MKIKSCTKCKIKKNLSEYRKRSDSKDGHSHICKICLSKDNKEYRSRPEIKTKIKKIQKDYYEKNKPKLLKKMKKYYQENKKSCNKNAYKYAKNNRGKRNALNSKRRKATPKWLTDNQKKEMENLYIKCKDMEKLDDVKYHVDHIIPINGKNVCGLHVPWNLQILKACENRKKSNKVLIEVIE